MADLAEVVESLFDVHNKVAPLVGMPTSSDVLHDFLNAAMRDYYLARIA